MSTVTQPLGVDLEVAARPRAVPRFRHLTRLASLDVLFALLIGAATIVLSLTHPWTQAQIGEAQFGDAEFWDQGAESWARGYVAVKTPDIRPGYSLLIGMI